MTLMARQYVVIDSVQKNIKLIISFLFHFNINNQNEIKIKTSTFFETSFAVSDCNKYLAATS